MKRKERTKNLSKSQSGGTRVNIVARMRRAAARGKREPTSSNQERWECFMALNQADREQFDEARKQIKLALDGNEFAEQIVRETLKEAADAGPIAHVCEALEQLILIQERNQD